MIDINSSLLIQLVNFIILLVVLNIILFKPIRQIMQDREQGISAAFSDAKAAQERMQNLLDQYNGSLAEAKQKATTAYNALYQQGLDVQRDTIAAERSKSGELLDKARSEIAEVSAAARGELRQEAERLSQDISAKLLGRAV
ncbi:MAG TPA: ATP synthase F0 subunit B [Nitrospirota bacterium]|nr:ATP synthase F0 subunit B [Nitrospirota bacterium]